MSADEFRSMSSKCKYLVNRGERAVGLCCYWMVINECKMDCCSKLKEDAVEGATAK